jgi:hypothetical protein
LRFFNVEETGDTDDTDELWSFDVDERVEATGATDETV